MIFCEIYAGNKNSKAMLMEWETTSLLLICTQVSARDSWYSNTTASQSHMAETTSSTLTRSNVVLHDRSVVHCGLHDRSDYRIIRTNSEMDTTKRYIIAMNYWSGCWCFEDPKEASRLDWYVDMQWKDWNARTKQGEKICTQRSKAWMEG